MKNLKARKNKNVEKNFALRLSVYILMVIFFAGVVVSALVLCIHYSGITFGGHIDLVIGIGAVGAVILIVGIITGILNRYLMEPLEAVIEGTKKIKDGDFSVHIEKKQSFITKYTELDSLADCFNEMAEELRGAEMFSRDFMSNFSHEFKTPLASIRGFAAQLYESEGEREKTREFAKIILTESAYLDNLCSNTLTFTKLEAQSFAGKREEYMLDEQLRSVMISFEPQWSEKNLDISIDSVDDIRVFQCEELLGHVWRNLLDNAIKYTPENGSITVSCADGDEYVTVCVSDTGIGIDKEDIGHVFDKCYQSKNVRAYGGNGLGLALAKRAVDVCGGEISVESELGCGSRFCVSLPKNL